LTIITHLIVCFWFNDDYRVHSSTTDLHQLARIHGADGRLGRIFPMRDGTWLLCQELLDRTVMSNWRRL
jgi:hypothetical protein